MIEGKLFQIVRRKVSETGLYIHYDVITLNKDFDILKANISADIQVKVFDTSVRVSHTLKNWVDGVSDEVNYPWESPKKIRLQSVKPTFASEQKKVSIHQ